MSRIFKMSAMQELGFEIDSPVERRNSREQYKLSEEYWRTKDGKVKKIACLEDNHLLNIVKWFEPKRTQEQLRQWRSYEGVLQEIAKRGLDARLDWDT